MRRTVTYALLIGGFVLMVVSYFLLATPWGTASVANSDPRVPFAATMFIIGVVAAIGSAVAYDVIHDKSEGQSGA